MKNAIWPIVMLFYHVMVHLNGVNFRKVVGHLDGITGHWIKSMMPLKTGL